MVFAELNLRIFFFGGGGEAFLTALCVSVVLFVYVCMCPETTAVSRYATQRVLLPILFSSKSPWLKSDCSAQGNNYMQEH